MVEGVKPNRRVLQVKFPALTFVLRFPAHQVNYDDGTMELGVDPRHLRRPEEACRRGYNSSRSRESGVQTTGPDWERQPIRPAVGARVAVYGVCKARLCQLVACLMVRGKFAVIFAILGR